MTERLENALASEFPFMTGIGTDCGDGWYPLIREMCEEITAVYEAAGRPVDINVDQVKEKYGALCFYYHPYDPQVTEIADRYEDRSTCVCEICGAPGSLCTDLPWMQTLCREHHEREKARWVQTFGKDIFT